MNETSWDKDRGRILILGRRHLAIDAQALCEHVDSLVGSKICEVILNQHEFLLGKEDVVRILQERPTATPQEVIEAISESGRLSGVGITAVSTPPDLNGPVIVEILDPVVKGTSGGAKVLLAAYWCGAISQLFGKPYATKQANYDEARNAMKYYLETRENQ